MNYKENLDLTKIPKHVAIIMDGNGRWAKKQGMKRIFGHRNAIEAVRQSVEAAAEIGINFLTLYTFSKENNNRPKEEVDALMSLLVEALEKETKTLMKNNISLKAIGNINDLPINCQKNLNKTINETANNTRMTLVLALNYGSRYEITECIKNISKDVSENKLSIENINEDLISNYLYTKNFPDPELVIRTSGELRISNFLLWQIAYSEFYFTEKLWPDYRKEDLWEALYNYQNRERRFGKTSEQIENK